MERVLVTSDTIRSVGYDGASSLLEIEFIKTGVYQYFAVPKSIHDALMAAESKGKFFNRNIRPAFEAVKL